MRELARRFFNNASESWQELLMNPKTSECHTWGMYGRYMTARRFPYPVESASRLARENSYPVENVSRCAGGFPYPVESVSRCARRFSHPVESVSQTAGEYNGHVRT